jgi:transcriptional regulator of heat shock response
LFNKSLIMGVVIEGNGSLEWKNPSGISKNNFLAISAGTFYSVDKRTVHLLKNDSRSKLLVIALFHYPGLKGKQLKSFLLTKKQSSSKKKNKSKSGLKKLIQHGDINFSLLKGCIQTSGKQNSFVFALLFNFKQVKTQFPLREYFVQ